MSFHPPGKIIDIPSRAFALDPRDSVDRLLISTDNHLQHHEYLQAQHCAEQALQQAERINQKRKGCAFVWLAEVHCAQGNHQHALEQYRKAVECFEMQDDAQGQIIILSYIVEMHRDHREWDQVIRYCNAAIKLAYRLEDMCNSGGRFEKAKEYQAWQLRFQQVLDHAHVQYDAAARSTSAPTPVSSSPTTSTWTASSAWTMPASSPGPSSAPTFQPARSADELAKRLTDLERQVKDNAAQVSRHLSKLEVSIQSLLEQTGKRLAGLEGSSGSVMRRLDELTKLEEQNKNNSTRLSQHAGKLGVAIQGLEEQTNNDLRQVSRQLGELENQVREIGQHVDKRAGSLDAQLAELEKQAKSNTGQIAEQLVGQLESQISGLDTLSEKHVKSLADRLDHLENRAGSKLEGLVHQLYQLDTRLREGQGGEQYDLLIHRLAGLEKQAKDDSAQVSQQLLKLEAHIANISSQVNKQMELLATQSVHQTQPKHGWRSTPHRFSVKTIPVYDPIAAGKPRPVAEDVIGYIETEQLEIDGRPMDPVPLKGTEITLTQEYDYAAMQVVGDSMNEADILPGDYVILRRPNRVEWQPEHRDIVAVVFRDQEPEATLKRILIERDRVTLRPESSNPAHEPRTVSRSALFGAEASAAIVWIAVAVLKLAHQE